MDTPPSAETRIWRFPGPRGVGPPKGTPRPGILKPLAGTARWTEILVFTPRHHMI